MAFQGTTSCVGILLNTLIASYMLWHLEYMSTRLVTHRCQTHNHLYWYDLFMNMLAFILAHPLCTATNVTGSGSTPFLLHLSKQLQHLLPFLKFHISQNHGSSRDQIGILLNTFGVSSMLPTFGVHTNDAIMNISIWHKTKHFIQSLYEFACHLRVLIM
jgi:hypothetical protein